MGSDRNNAPSVEGKSSCFSTKPGLTGSTEISVYINEVLENERARIAREMHDELGQQLTILKMDMDTIQRNSSQENTSLQNQVQEAMVFVDHIIDTVRRISLELRPSILDDLGLLAALEWQCDSFQRKMGIPCDFRQSVTYSDFEKGFTNAAFRILQEALTNIGRHAKATHVIVSVVEKNSALAIEVADNGKGFSGNEGEKKTLGILGMRERSRLTGGELNISSEEGKGTIVKVTLPFNQLKQTDT